MIFKNIFKNLFSYKKEVMLLLCVCFVLFLILEYTTLYLTKTISPIEQQFDNAGFRRTGHPYAGLRFLTKTNKYSGHDWLTKDPKSFYQKDFRKKPISLLKNGEFRIFILGGSTVYLGNPAIPELIEQKFKKEGYHNVSVYNFGLVSSNSSDELARLFDEIIDYKPDLVVFYNGGNDFYQPLAYDPRPCYPYNYFAVEENPLQKSVADYPTLYSLLFSSNIFRLTLYGPFRKYYAKLYKYREKVSYGTDNWRKSIATCYIRNIKKAHQLLNNYQISFLAFLQPMLYYKKKLQGAKEIRFGSKERSYNAMASSHVIKIKNMLLEKTKTMNLKYFYNLTELFSEEEKAIFTDMIHIEQSAKAKVSSALFQKIIENIKIPKI